jgi:DNA-binding response OmpR family regulator
VVDIIKGLEMGGDNFIPKPFEDDYLLQRLRRIFEHLEVRSQGYREIHVTLRVGDREVIITLDEQQMVELLFSNYEELCQLNTRLDDHAKSHETEVQLRTQQLREAEAKYRMLVEHIPAVTYLAALNPGEHMLYISPQVEPLLGFTVYQWLTVPNL